MRAPYPVASELGWTRGGVAWQWRGELDGWRRKHLFPGGISGLRPWLAPGSGWKVGFCISIVYGLVSAILFGGVAPWNGRHGLRKQREAALEARIVVSFHKGNGVFKPFGGLRGHAGRLFWGLGADSRTRGADSPCSQAA